MTTRLSEGGTLGPATLSLRASLLELSYEKVHDASTSAAAESNADLLGSLVGKDRGHNQWTIAIVTALIGLGGAFGGAWIGGLAASTAATEQIKAVNADRYRESRAEAYMEMVDVLLDLRASWISWSSVYPASPPSEVYRERYLIPLDIELAQNINQFSKALARIEAFGSAKVTDLTGEMTGCVNQLASKERGEGPWGGRKPPTSDELETHGNCLFNGAMELAKFAEIELSPKENPDLSVTQ